jgi:hypothetical protein
VHGIGDEALAAFGASSKMNNEWGFLQHLHEIGRRAADQWLVENFTAIGNRSTVDLSGLLPQRHGSLSAPSLAKHEPLPTADAEAKRT